MMFHIVAPAGSSKTEMQLLAASVSGFASDGVVSLDTFASDQTATWESNRGALLLIGDPRPTLAARGLAQRQAMISRVVFEQAAFNAGRVGFLIGDRRLAEWVGAESDIGRAIDEVVISLEIACRKGLGVYTRKKKGGVANFNSRLRQRIATTQGAPSRAFIEEVMQALMKDEARFRRDITRLVDKFVDATRVDPNDTIAVRKARSFGLVFAAGLKAKRLNILPSSWSCSAAVIRCYRQHLTHPSTTASPKSIVRAIALAPETLRLDSEQPPSMEEIMTADALIRGSGPQLKLFIPQRKIKNFPQLNVLLRDDRTRKMLISPDPVASKQRLGSAGLHRVYAFAVPKAD